MVERIAVASEGLGGLEDEVSSVFGKCSSFTVIDVEDGSIKEVTVEENPYVNRSSGVGPLVSEMLHKLDVKIVIAGEFGPGALSVLKDVGIKAIVKPKGTKIKDEIQRYLGKTSILF